VPTTTPANRRPARLRRLRTQPAEARGPTRGALRREMGGARTKSNPPSRFPPESNQGSVPTLPRGWHTPDNRDSALRGQPVLLHRPPLRGGSVPGRHQKCVPCLFGAVPAREFSKYFSGLWRGTVLRLGRKADPISTRRFPNNPASVFEGSLHTGAIPPGPFSVLA
jgi:hypothetical protein